MTLANWPYAYRTWPRACGWLLGLCLLLSGCGPGNMSPVAGTVKYDDGSPVIGGEVSLHPIDDPQLPSPVGYIQPDGSFKLFTRKPGDGVRQGKYKVVVAPPTDDYGPKNPRPIDPKFSDPNTSGIQFEVQPGDNVLTISVTRPKK